MTFNTVLLVTLLAVSLIYFTDGAPTPEGDAEGQPEAVAIAKAAASAAAKAVAKALASALAKASATAEAIAAGCPEGEYCSANEVWMPNRKTQ